MAKTNAMQKMVEIAQSSGPEIERHLQALGTFDDEILHSQVLCMTYIESEMTAGGIIKPQKSIEEDRFQGKLFLVVAMGPGAFLDDRVAQFHGVTIKPKDWVLARPSDGMELFYNGCTMRLFQDVNMLIRVKERNLYKYW
jgi:co-chaperonin GroES (HSP10)